MPYDNRVSDVTDSQPQLQQRPHLTSRRTTDRIYESLLRHLSRILLQIRNGPRSLELLVSRSHTVCARIVQHSDKMTGGGEDGVGSFTKLQSVLLPPYGCVLGKCLHPRRHEKIGVR